MGRLTVYVIGLLVPLFVGCSPKADPSLSAPIVRPEPDLVLELEATANAPNSQEIHLSVYDSSTAEILRVKSLSIDAFEDNEGHSIGKFRTFSWRHQPPEGLGQETAKTPIELQMIFRSAHRGTIGLLSGTMQLTTGTEKEVQIPVEDLQKETDTLQDLTEVGIQIQTVTSSVVGISFSGDNVRKIEKLVLVDSNGETIGANRRFGGGTQFTWLWNRDGTAPEDFHFRILYGDENKEINWKLSSSEGNKSVFQSELGLEALLTRMDFCDISLEGPDGVFMAGYILDPSGQIVSSKPRTRSVGLTRSWDLRAPKEAAKAVVIKLAENSKEVVVDIDLRDIEIR